MAKKTSDKVLPPSAPSRKRRLLRWLFQPRSLLLVGLAVSSVYWFPLVRNALPELSQRDEYQFDPRRIAINEPPHWVPHNLVEQVVSRAKLGSSLSILEDDLTARIAQAFAQHPWVAGVVEVRKQPFPARVTARLLYREPVAMIEKRTGFYPVDVQGILLPPEDFSLSETTGYLKIRGVRSIPAGMPGANWGDPLVVGAARVARALIHEWIPLGIKAVHVPDRTTAEVDLNESMFVLETIGGSRILWGLAPGVEVEGELTIEQKLGRLRKYVADYGSLDRPAGPYEIDIRHWRQISRKKLNVTRDARRESLVR